MDPCISNGLQLFPFAHHKLCTHHVLRQVAAFFIQPGLRHARVGVELGSSHFGLEDRTGHYLLVTFFIPCNICGLQLLSFAYHNLLHVVTVSCQSFVPFCSMDFLGFPSMDFL